MLCRHAAGLLPLVLMSVLPGMVSSSEASPLVDLQEALVGHDAKHIKADFESLFGFMFGDFSDEDLDFSYFTIHDYDRNHKLDGLELMSALRHVNHSNNNQTTTSHHEHHNDERTLEQYTDAVDLMLEIDDKNNDGFISFPEYKKGTQVKKTVKK